MARESVCRRSEENMVVTQRCVKMKERCLGKVVPLIRKKRGGVTGNEGFGKKLKGFKGIQNEVITIEDEEEESERQEVHCVGDNLKVDSGIEGASEDAQRYFVEENVNGQEESLEDKVDQALKKLSVGWIPQETPCRQKESEQIFTFLQDALATGTNNSMYISGLPGSGKTLTLQQTLQSFLQSLPADSHPPVQTHYLNCASLSTPTSFYTHLLTTLSPRTKPTATPKTHLCNHFATRSSPLVLVLDELDYLTTRDQSALYQIFSWPHLQNSNVTVIGIANEVDLLERSLPYLRAARCTPKRLCFRPYDAKELFAIVEQRLGCVVEGAGEENVGMFGRKGLELLTRRVAAGCGDARRCLDVCRMCIMRARQLYKKNGGCRTKGNKYCSLGVIAEVLQKVGGASSAVKVVQGLPMAQQVVLGVVARMSGKGRVSLGQIHTFYGQWCSKCRMSGVKWSEFVDVVNVLRHHDLVEVNDYETTKSQGRRKSSGARRRTVGSVKKSRSSLSKASRSSAIAMKGRIVKLKCAKEDVQKGCEGRGLLRYLVGKEVLI